MTQQEWRATISYASAPTPISDDQADALVQHLPGYGIVHHDGRRIHLSMTVQASTLRKAEDEAHKAARAAYAAAFDVVGTEVACHVLTEEDHQRELTDPAPMDLVGIKEIQEILAKDDGTPITQQQASQIVKRPDFPKAVGTPGGRPVFTRRSVAAFRRGWNRTPGWAGKHTNEAGTPA